MRIVKCRLIIYTFINWTLVCVKELIAYQLFTYIHKYTKKTLEKTFNQSLVPVSNKLKGTFNRL